MTRKNSGTLIVYAVLITGISSLLPLLGVELTRSAVIVGFAGGVLCAVWGLIGLKANSGKGKALVTLMVMAFVYLAEAVNGFFAGKESTGSSAGLWLVVVSLTGTMTMIVKIAYTGVPTLGASSSRTAEATSPLPRNKALR